MFRRYVIWFIALVFVVNAQAIPSDATESRRELALSHSPTKALCPSLHCNHSSKADNVELSRSKRGIPSLVLRLTSLGVQAGSFAVNLAGLISKGCAYFPSICTNLELIESYTKDAEREKSELEELFVQYSKEYVQLREALINNDIIAHHTNSTIKIIGNIRDIGDTIQAVLQSKLLFLSKAASHWEANNSIDFILQGIDSIEYDFLQIQEMLRKHQTNTLIGIVGWTLIGVAIDRFSSALDRAYRQVLDSQPPLVTNIHSEKGVVRRTMSKVWQKLKNLKFFPKVMKQMGINVMNSIRKALKSGLKISKKVGSIPIQSIKALRRFFTDIRTEYTNKGMRGAFLFATRKLGTQPYAKTISKFQRIASKIKVSVVKLPHKLVSYKMGFVSKLNSVLGIVGDVTHTISSVLEWEKISDNVETTMQQHRKYLEGLRQEKKRFEDQKSNVPKEWQNALEDFKGRTKSFISLFSLLMESNDFLDVIGLMKPPVKKAQLILSVDFQSVTKESVIGMQTKIIGFLNENNNNLTKIKNGLKAREISYKKIKIESEEGKSIKDITEDLRELYSYMPYDESRQFGANLAMEDVVCALAIIRKDLEFEYDGFQLQPFRPRCEVNDTAFANMKKAAYQQRRIIIIDDVIQRELTDANIVLSQLKNRISKELSNEDSKNTNSVVNDTDIVCRISILYPNKTEFDFIPLQSFRPSCADVDENMMTTLKSKAVKMRNIAESLEPLSIICKQYKYCPCIPTIRQTLPGTTDEDIKTTIKRFNPGKTEYCGTTGCKCVQL